jgi:hypothetical protein
LSGDYNYIELYSILKMSVRKCGEVEWLNILMLLFEMCVDTECHVDDSNKLSLRMVAMRSDRMREERHRIMHFVWHINFGDTAQRRHKI